MADDVMHLTGFEPDLDLKTNVGMYSLYCIVNASYHCC